ncbi:hypothetical protein F7U66_00575 [Vibrio parahaemolyticus]|nr:hypothetical protein [Vibrio parahaemolyticus]
MNTLNKVLMCTAMLVPIHASAITLHKDSDSRLDLSMDLSANYVYKPETKDSSFQLTDSEISLVAAHKLSYRSELLALATIKPESLDSFSNFEAKEVFLGYKNRDLGEVRLGQQKTVIGQIVDYTQLQSRKQYSLTNNNPANGFSYAENTIQFETTAKAKRRSPGATKMQLSFQSNDSFRDYETKNNFQTSIEYAVNDLKFSAGYSTAEVLNNEDSNTWIAGFSKGTYGKGLYLAGVYGKSQNAFLDRFNSLLEDTQFYIISASHSLPNGLTLGASFHSAYTGDDNRGGVFSNANFESYSELSLSMPISKKSTLELIYSHDLNGDGAFERKDVDHTMKAGLNFVF